MTPWRIIVKKDQPYTFHANHGGTRRLCITKVSFEPPHSTITKCNYLHVVSCQVGTQSPIVLCTMVTILGFTTDLHVEFGESETIVFSTTGYRAIHLVGHFKETIKYLTRNHLLQLLNYSPIAPAKACNTTTDQRIGHVQSLDKLVLSNLDTFQGELNSTVANSKKEPPKIDHVLPNEITNGFVNQIAGIRNIEKTQPATTVLETNVNINETPKDVGLLPDTTELKKHCRSAEKNEVNDLEKNEVNDLEKNEVNDVEQKEVNGLKKNEVRINDTIDVISKYEVLQPAMSGFDNNSANDAITKIYEIHPENIEIGEVTMAMTDTEEYVPDSKDNWNNDVNENHINMRKQETKKCIAPQFYYGNLGSINLEEQGTLDYKDLEALIRRQSETFQKMRRVLPDKGDKIRVTINQLEKEKERRKLCRLEQEVLSNDNQKVRDSSTCYLLNHGESVSNCLLKKTNASGILCLHDARLIKEQPVVIVDEEENQITDTPRDAEKIAESLKEITLYYPSRDGPQSVEISHSDMGCLAPKASLTSTIMNFYIRYLQLATVVDKERNDYHFFNTYFYEKLKETLSYKGSDKETLSYFMKFRKWWKGVNIFQKAYVFIPIHEYLHWSLVIICIPDEEDESGPIILHLDSLKLHVSSTVLNNIRSYIKKEWDYLKQEVSPSDVLIAEKIGNNMPCGVDEKKIEVPQQKNSYDCGLFVLYFMERFIEEAPDRMKKKDLAAMFGKQWFQPEEASGLREKILHKLMHEFMQRTEN